MRRFLILCAALLGLGIPSLNGAGFIIFVQPTCPSTPAGYFTIYPGATGAWYDASDTSQLFQDSACTTPVTMDSDPVGCWKDKSGGGNTMVQATAGLRPLWHTSGGLSWVQFDGSDDILTSTNTFTLTSPYIVSMAASYASGANAGQPGTFGVVRNSTNYYDVGQRQNTQSARSLLRGASASSAIAVARVQGANNSYPDTTPAVETSRLLADGTLTGRINAVSLSASVASGWTAGITDTSFAFTVSDVGTAVAYVTKIYQGFAINKEMPVSEVHCVETYECTKGGITC